MTIRPRVRTLNPGQMTPQERLERLIELLANGVVHAVKNNAADPTIDTCAQSTPAILKEKGRVPFGQCKVEEGRAANPAEEYWIAQIKRLSAEGFSSEQIARQLNQEDQMSRRAGQWSRTAVWRILQRLKHKDVTK